MIEAALLCTRQRGSIVYLGWLRFTLVLVRISVGDWVWLDCSRDYMLFDVHWCTLCQTIFSNGVMKVVSYVPLDKTRRQRAAQILSSQGVSVRLWQATERQKNENSVYGASVGPWEIWEGARYIEIEARFLAIITKVDRKDGGQGRVPY